MTMPSFAADYYVWVSNGTELVKIKNDSDPVQIGGGTVHFVLVDTDGDGDPNEAHLNFENVNLVPVDATAVIDDASEPSASAAIVIKGINVNINWKGNNSITQANSIKDNSYGIYSEEDSTVNVKDGTLNISFRGTGYKNIHAIKTGEELNLKNSNLNIYTVQAENVIGISKVKSAELENSTLTVYAAKATNGDSKAINSNKQISLKNSTIHAKSSDASKESVAMSVGNVTMNDKSTIHASAGNADDSSMALRCNEIKLINESSINVSAGNAGQNSYAVSCADIDMFENSTINATAGNAANKDSIAIDSMDIKMEGSSTINAYSAEAPNGLSYAIYCSTLTSEDSTVNATSDSMNSKESIAVFVGSSISTTNSEITAVAGDAKKKTQAIRCLSLTMDQSTRKAKAGSAVSDENTVVMILKLSTGGSSVIPGFATIDNQSVLRIDTTSNRTFRGLFVSGDLTITNNSIVSAIATGSNFEESTGIDVNTGKLILGVDADDQSAIYAHAGKGYNSYAIILGGGTSGIDDGHIIRGGAINATASSRDSDEFATGSAAIKVDTIGSLTIHGGTLRLESTGDSTDTDGISTSANIFIQGGIIEIKGARQAIQLREASAAATYDDTTLTAKQSGSIDGELAALGSLAISSEDIKRLKIAAKDTFNDDAVVIPEDTTTPAPNELPKPTQPIIPEVPTEPSTPSSGGGSGGGGSSYSSVRPDSDKKEAVKSDKTQEFKFRIGSQNITVTENSSTKTIAMALAPFIENGRTMVPLRYVGEVLGLEVKWNATEKIVTLLDEKNEIIVPINSLTMKVNGKEVQSDVLPVLTQGRTNLSISNVAKALGLEQGKDILWDHETKTVIVIKEMK